MSSSETCTNTFAFCGVGLRPRGHISTRPRIYGHGDASLYIRRDDARRGHARNGIRRMPPRSLASAPPIISHLRLSFRNCGQQCTRPATQICDLGSARLSTPRPRFFHPLRGIAGRPVGPGALPPVIGREEVAHVRPVTRMLSVRSVARNGTERTSWNKTFFRDTRLFHVRGEVI